MRLLASISEVAPKEPILSPIGEPPQPPPIAPTRAPPAWDDDLEPTPHWDAWRPPEPEFEFDKRIAW